MILAWTDDQIAAALTDLRQPFPLDVVQLKVGATTERDGIRSGLALLYADWWTGYLPVLQRVLGPGAWSIALTPWGNQKVIAQLTACGGRIVHWSSGEGDPDDPNGGTIAEAQAKKRVCAEALGLGLYLYHAPKFWGALADTGKNATFAPGEEQRLKREIYGRMGLIPAPAPDEVPPEPSPARLQRARTALADAERQVGMRPRPARPNAGASEKQVGAILSLLRACRAADTPPATLTQLGTSFGLVNLASVQQPDDLAALPKASASQLITSLQQLAPQRASRAA